MPVKKMPEQNGVVSGPPAQLMEGRGVELGAGQTMAPSPAGGVVDGNAGMEARQQQPQVETPSQEAR